jgi:N-acetyl-gamma-glutamyl-phosphate reductase
LGAQSSIQSKTIKAAVVGATGYSGLELARLLAAHPAVESLQLYSSPRNLGELRSADSGSAPIASDGREFFRHSRSRVPIVPFDTARLNDSGADVVFFATPNETSHELIPQFQDAKFKIIDLSGSFRLPDPSLYRQWYGFDHAASQLLPRFVYGLPEMNLQSISKAQWVANPGCYATSVILPLLPLIRMDLIDHSAAIICDSKSGVSGAGKQPTANTHFCEISESFKAYSVFSHRHLPEIQQHLGLNGMSKIIFTPHLIPINRGILSTVYAKLIAPLVFEEVHGRLTEFYADAPFVRVLPRGELPQVKWVAHTNFCDIGICTEADSSWLILISCLDNLVKGAAGQAVQNMNLMFGLDQRTGFE